MIGERTNIDKTNDLCPECGNPMGWTEGLLKDGGVDSTVGRYGCMPCRIFAKPTESRAIRKGKELAPQYVKKRNRVRSIMKYKIGTQIGILRALQHCATCDNDAGSPCTCNGKCNCPHCMDRGNYKSR